MDDLPPLGEDATDEGEHVAVRPETDATAGAHVLDLPRNVAAGVGRSSAEADHERLVGRRRGVTVLGVHGRTVAREPGANPVGFGKFSRAPDAGSTMAVSTSRGALR